MEMTKKEQAEMESLKTRLALHFYPKVEPDIMPPESYSTILNGYDYNVRCKEVVKACTSSISHNYGCWACATSQGSRRLYSTPKLAYMALLSDMAEKYAEELREVEKRMEAAQV